VRRSTPLTDLPPHALLHELLAAVSSRATRPLQAAGTPWRQKLQQEAATPRKQVAATAWPQMPRGRGAALEWREACEAARLETRRGEGEEVRCNCQGRRGCGGVCIR